MSASKNPNGYLSIRIPNKMREQLDELAVRNMSSASQEVRLAIRRHLEEQAKVTA